MTEPTASAGSRPGRSGLIVLLVLALGVALRVRVQFGGRALWIDEAMLALNVVPRGFAGLLRPLDWDQGAPLAWLMLSKLLTMLFGTGERALRAPAFLAALVTLPLVLRVARRELGERAAIVALAIYALMPAVIYQSSEFKPYTFDALFALVIVALHLDAVRPGADELPSRGRLALLAVVGAVSVWFSIPAAFVLAGCGTSVMLGDLLARRTRALRARVLVAAVWVASFAAQFVFLRVLLANPNLESYWQSKAAFLPFPPTTGEDLRVTLEIFFSVFRDPLRSPYTDALDVGTRAGMLLFAASAVGAVALWRRDRRMAGIFVLPFAVAALASASGLYPLQGRLLLFGAPLLALLAGCGIGALRESGERTARGAGVVLLGGLLLWPLAGAADVLQYGPVREEVDDCLAHLAEHAQPGDRLWIYYGARPAYEYYARTVGRFDDSAFVVAFGAPRSPRFEDQELSLRCLVGHGRAWILFSHVHEAEYGDERVAILALLDTLGTRLETFEAPGASLVLYDL
ncbi:MAG: glycosyltransferase family 39 protein [Planctomycetes bacterium]|nr:glycosyltransferase family 39 protein [Planctomycetota bacterium]